MSFLESVQHGIEKASQEAARLAKIQHLHGIVNDLTFKVNQDSHDLIAKSMELFQGGHLTQSELLPICQQITTYQQQIAEVQEEIQKLHAEQPQDGAQAAPAPGAVPAYPPYPAAPPSPYAPPPVYTPYPAAATPPPAPQTAPPPPASGGTN